MKKITTLLFILFNALYLNLNPLYAENLTDCRECMPEYTLEKDVLYRSGLSVKTKLYDRVAAVSRDKDTLYYIRKTDRNWMAGFYKESSEAGFEFIIPGKFEKLYKFAGSSNIFYYLIAEELNNADSSDATHVLVRFNPASMNSQRIEDVVDFFLLDSKSIILKEDSINYNGSIIPLILPGRLKISEIIDSRIAVISGEDETEIVDLLAERSIYQYKNNSVPESPENYNIILEFADNITNTVEPESIIYYEIHVDGIEENRTETGRGELSKIFYSKLAAGKYHIIKPERWELDKTKGRYSRMNNIFQPDELKIYIPANRIIKIKMEFDGAAYKIYQSVLYK